MRGLGKIYKRKDTWWVSYYSQGKRYRESSHSHLQGDATQLLQKRLGEIGKGTHDALIKASSTTLADLVKLINEDYVINTRKDSSRMTSCTSRLTQFFHLGMRATEIDSDALRRYSMHRHREGAKPATIQRELAIMGRMLTLGAQNGMLAFRPKLPTIKVNNAREGFLSTDAVQRIRSYLPCWLQGAILFAFLTGWRISEVLSLRWSQVNLDSGTCTVSIGNAKNGESRTFPCKALPELADLIERQHVNRNGPYVFHNLGNFIRDYRGAWRAATRSAGIPDALVHDLRRSAIRNFEQAGIPRSVAMKLSGHKTESVYRRYAIVSESDMEAAVSKLNLLGRQSQVVAVGASAGGPQPT